MSEKREQKKQRRWIFGLVALVVFSMSAILGIVGLGNSIGEIREVEVAQSPTALLANAGAEQDKVITLPVTYYDQISDKCVSLYDENEQEVVTDRQWEWGTCGYYGKKIEQGLAQKELSEEGLPVADGGEMLPNRGVNFEGWFNEVEGISSEVPGTLSMHYRKDDANFSFVADSFYPLDEVDFSEGDPVNDDGHNHLFTMNFAVPFTVLGSGEESFAITADDDTLVYLDGELVIDMGGVHGAKTGKMVIDADGKVYANVDDGEWEDTGVATEVGKVATLAVFHADRDAVESVMELDFTGMNLALNDGVQIAAVSGADAGGVADGFVQPLGESKVFEPDAARSLMLIATIEGVLVLVAAVLVVMVARYMVKQKTQG